MSIRRSSRQFNPTSQEAWGDLRSNYAAARSSRFRRARKGLPAMGAGADWHYQSESDYLKLMELARDMDRNDVIVGQTVNRAVVNTVQDGFALDVATGDEELDAELMGRWQEWANSSQSCDLAGEMTFWDWESLTLRATLVDGDLVLLATENGSLQAIEGHRVRTPRNTKRNVVHGVLLDSMRRRLQYWITKDDIDPSRMVTRVSDIRQVDTFDENGLRQLFHVYDPKRVSQTRGISALVPIFDLLGQFEDIQFAKLVQQQIVSCLGLIHERELDFGGGAAPAIGAITTDTFSDGTTQTIEGISPGQHYIGQPGEKLSAFSPSVPNPEYFPHVNLMLTLVGINLGLPLVLLLMDGSQTNFSGWRGAVDQARMGFRRNQRWLINKFHRPVYLWKVTQWLGDRIEPLQQAGLDPFGHKWNPPTWPYIEPMKDASADLLRQRNLLNSPRRIQAERGRNWEEIQQEIVDDYSMAVIAAKTKAQEINAAIKDDSPVDWRELLSPYTADDVSVSLRPDAPQSEGAEPTSRPSPPRALHNGNGRITDAFTSSDR